MKYKAKKKQNKKIERKQSGMTGWMCPVCGCGNSPFVLTCQERCHIRLQTVTTTTNY